MGFSKLIWVICAIPLLASQTACSGDCIWYDEAKAWVDENKNGVWDDDEKPLAGVQFFIDDTLNGHVDVGEEAISGEEGNAELSVWLPGCPSVEFEVYVKSPDGFEVFTADRVLVTKKEIRNPGENTFLFGFVPSNGE